MSSAVNRPTNVKQKEQDVNQKLQLYGIYSAFANGKVPSNAQIDVALNSFLASKALASPSKKLSSEGQKLVGDFRAVVEQAKNLLLSKNEGNLLQDFIWSTENVTGANASLPGAPVDKATAQQHGNQAVEGLRTLGTLLLSNGQFRKLLSDTTVLIRDMAGDAAQTAATKINPSEDALSQIDRPAEDNTWHEVPSVGELKSTAKETLNKNKPFSKSDVQDAAGDASAAGHPSGSRDPAEVARLEAEAQQQDGASSADPTAGAQAGLATLKDKAKENVPDENQDRARELKEATRQKTKAYFQKKMPQERREQTVWRLKKMIVEIQGHEDYTQAVETLLNLAEQYTGHAKNVTGQTAGTVKGAHADDSLMTAEANLKTLIERFANSTSTDDLFDSINQIYRDANSDPELKKWFKAVDAYVRKCLQQQGYIMQDASNDEGNQLYDHGRFLLRERYRDHTNRILDETKFLASQFEEDSQNKRFGESLQKLFTDLGNDENGKPTFKKHLVTDLTNVIAPAAFESVSYIPIPRIEYSDPMLDAIVENLVIESDNLMPNSLEVQSDNYFKWGRKTVASRNKNKATIAVSGVQMDLRDVSYYIKKKEGFPSITDKGVMDIFMGGSGFSFKMGIETADKADSQHFFKVNTVKVDIQNLKLKMKQSNHKLLFNIFKPLLLKVVKPALTKIIEKQIKDSFHQGDAFAYSVQKEAELALEEAKNNPENAQNIYARYVSAVQKKVTEGKQKTEQISANTTANVAMTQHDSIFKDIKLPGGISTKATEYKELAAKGDKWESPVFGIGSASPSTNIPKVSPITRKPHSTTQSQLRGGAPGVDSVANSFQGQAGNGLPSGGVTSGLQSNANGSFQAGSGTLGTSEPSAIGTHGADGIAYTDLKNI